VVLLNSNLNQHSVRVVVLINRILNLNRRVQVVVLLNSNLNQHSVRVVVMQN
jgi:hypothetical protein